MIRRDISRSAVLCKWVPSAPSYYPIEYISPAKRSLFLWSDIQWCSSPSTCLPRGANTQRHSRTKFLSTSQLSTNGRLRNAMLRQTGGKTSGIRCLTITHHFLCETMRNYFVWEEDADENTSLPLTSVCNRPVYENIITDHVHKRHRLVSMRGNSQGKSGVKRNVHYFDRKLLQRLFVAQLIVISQQNVSARMIRIHSIDWYRLPHHAYQTKRCNTSVPK